VIFRIVVANLGDSRAILSRGGIPIVLTEDHRPSNPAEYGRIKKAGGTIEENRELNLARLYQINPELLGASQIPQRLADMVGFVTFVSLLTYHHLLTAYRRLLFLTLHSNFRDYRIQGCLAVSRAIGDFEMKKGYWDAGEDESSWTEDLVSCIPAVKIVDRDPQDEFIVAASDGSFAFVLLSC
jgi:serine/threonine protein phosphatase PrpC